MDQITKKFPENKAIGLEENVVPIILRQAIADYIEYLEKQELSTLSRTVVRPHSGGMIWVEVEFPNYPRWLDGNTQEEVLDLDGVRVFFDYVWERGEMIRSFTGPNPTRRTWETALVWEILHLPIRGLLDFSALTQAVDIGVVADPWTITSIAMDQFINELTKRYCKGLQSVIVQCPLAWFTLQPGTSVDLGCGMSLHNYDETRKAIYLSQTDNRTLWHDPLSKTLLQDIAILELTVDIQMDVIWKGKSSMTGDDFVKEIIANKLDMLKWSIMTAVERTIAPIEGTITYGGLFGERIGVTPFGSMRRQNKTTGTVFSLDINEINKIRESVSAASIWREKSKDVQAAFWYWGRAALADLSRDTLLESVIGLESLLVRSAGETRYKFGLHGAALLARSRRETTEKAKQLRKIYDQRSSAAHGGLEELFSEAYVAHKALGDLIAIVLHFYTKGHAKPEDRFAKQLEGNILAKAWLNPYAADQIDE